MEFKITQIPKIEPIRFNYEELKADLTASVEAYMTLAYTADTIKQAKADRSRLNALKKSLNDERIRLEREYMEPFQDFKAKVSELVGIVDEASKTIDKQVKEFEELKKQEKYDQVIAIWNETLFTKYDWLDIGPTWNDKWLNASYSLKQIRADLEDWEKKITADMGMLERLPEYSFEAIETYKRTLKVEDALWTADNLKQMAEAKKAQEVPELQPEPPHIPLETQEVEEYATNTAEPFMATPEPQKMPLVFRVYVTMEEAVKLANYMKAEGIQFERAGQ